MRRIRNKVFETNSSSSHSIVIGNDENDDVVLPIKVIPMWQREFDWEWDVWNSIEEKLAYMIRALVIYDYHDEDSLKEKIKPIQNNLHSIGIDFDMPTYEEFEEGYLDHPENYHDEMEYIYSDNELLLKFLLNEDSYVRGGNDNEPED